jgi:putative transposase
MAQVRIWVHAVWTTKSREPLLANKNKRIDIFKHIKSHAKKKNIYLDFINGVADHVHVLISLACDQTIAQVIAWLKGESSRYINEHKITETYFDWADDYYAVSVSQSNVETVRNYLKKQDIHHEKKTFTEECEEFMSKYGFVRMLG